MMVLFVPVFIPVLWDSLFENHIQKGEGKISWQSLRQTRQPGKSCLDRSVVIATRDNV